ncbi:MAG: hypothetical protein LBV72_19245 [Tannerella sp.]|jgi:hypothetical protein|nr:hypothetical protein [Tannerella sp.]
MNPTKKIHKGKEKKTEQASTSLYDKLNLFFDRNQKSVLIISMVLSVLMSIFLFDVKVSLSGDDSDYILYADSFWKKFIFPGFRGPLYPIVLSPLVGIFGMNLVLLKSLSAISIVLSVWLLYKSFKDKIDAVILMPAIFLISICSYIFFYAGYTYSEPFFMLIQALFIYFFSKYYLTDVPVSYSIKTDWRKYLILGSLALCMGLTRSIGYAVVGAAILFFIVNCKWKDLLYMLSASIIVFGAFQLFKMIVWPDAGSAYDINRYLAKDYYNLNQGMEDLPGFIERFKENSLVYLSNFLYQFMGLMGETPSNYMNVDPIRTILMYVLFAICLIAVFRKNKALLFLGLYIGVMNFVSFVLLQSNWGQDRLIMIYYPLILVFLLGGICYLLRIEKVRKLFFVYPIVLVVVCFGTLSITKNRIARNIPILQQNILGDQLYGLTPDWQNFIKASQWVTKNLDPAAKIVSRKPSISKVYTGRDFSGDPQALTASLESLLQLKNTDEHTLFIVAENNQYSFQSPFFKYLIGAKSKSLFINNQAVGAAFLYVIPNTEVDNFMQSISGLPINYTLDYEPFYENCKREAGQLRIFDPDMMMEYLINNNINYLLLAQLRIDSTQNTGVYLNSIHRFVWYISYKYPNVFQLTHTVGKEEPCEIVQFVPQR